MHDTSRVNPQHIRIEETHDHKYAVKINLLDAYTINRYSVTLSAQELWELYKMAVQGESLLERLREINSPPIDPLEDIDDDLSAFQEMIANRVDHP